jgi:amino acid adenylation domain-containing protein
VIVELPTDRPRRAGRSAQWQTMAMSIVDKKIAFAAFVVLLWRYTRQDELTVQVDHEHVVRLDLTGRLTLEEVAGRADRAERIPGHSSVGFGAPAGELALYRDHIDYDSALFDESTVRRMLSHYESVLRAETRSPIAQLPLLNAAERRMMLREWNSTEYALPYDRCLHELFADQAQVAPDAVAVLDPEPTAYREIDERSTRLARRLVDLGVRAESIVGICLPRSADLLTAVLAVLKAGGAYLPLDGSYPVARVRHMVSEAGCDICVCAPDSDIPVATTVGVAEEGVSELPAVTPDQLCYVIFTSGSTGAPKGIALRHRGVVNNLADLNTRFRVGPGDRVLALSSPSFDMSVYEFLGMTIAGGTVVVPREQDPAHWADLLVAEDITVWNSAPALLRLLLDHAERTDLGFPLLRLAMLGGDWIPVSLPDRLRARARRVRFIALGGATESSVHSTLYEVTHTDPAWSSIPYGKPMANQRTYILDPDGQPSPIGVPGELHLAGIGLARGYLGLPELTAEKFLTWQGDRLYRTGDLARYRPDGQIELLGRLDFQVKIHGLRIELGEIEAALHGLPQVREAVVTAQPDHAGDKRLVAHVVPTGPELGDLRAELAEVLPAHMIPATFVSMRELPLSPNGKVDRRALPAPPPPLADSQAPLDDAERRIAAVWQEILGVPDVGREHNFLALGGDSFKALKAAKAIDPELPAHALLRHPTVRALAEHLRNR